MNEDDTYRKLTQPPLSQVKEAYKIWMNDGQNDTRLWSAVLLEHRWTWNEWAKEIDVENKEGDFYIAPHWR
jgi:hypothetical protein